MDSFEVSGMSNALKESSGNEIKLPTEAVSAAREKGWTTPEQYDYEKYTSSVTPLGPLQNGGEGNLPAWAAQAAKYEWQDDYGDVGPQNPALEEQLYRGEYINRTGLKIGK